MSKVFVNIGLSLDGYMAPEGLNDYRLKPVGCYATESGWDRLKPAEMSRG